MSTVVPVHDTPILGMTARPPIEKPTEFGNATSFWVEYPNGLVDVSRTAHLDATGGQPPPLTDGLLDIPMDGNRVVRVDGKSTALVVIDMQNFFLHPDLRDHPKGLACVNPLMDVIPPLRKAGAKIAWVNWGLTDHELTTIPPSLVRGFRKNGGGGFGSQLPGPFGRLLMRGEYNSDLYGPLHTAWLEGKEAGTDVWIHKNRMSGLWGPQSSLDLYLQEEGISTLIFSGVNADQCVLGTLIDSYYRGYDIIILKDATATTSPEGGYENVIYNAGGSYGFATDSKRVVEALKTK